MNIKEKQNKIIYQINEERRFLKTQKININLFDNLYKVCFTNKNKII